MQRILGYLFILIVTKAEGGQDPNYRVYKGRDDVKNEFPYVVCLQQAESLMNGVEFYRYCTGTLVAPEWVLTAAHCLKPQLQIVRYGNMTATDVSLKRRILKQIPHPSHKTVDGLPYYVLNDIGLLLIERISMNVAKLSAVDYTALIGGKVRFAGFGSTVHLTGLLPEEKIKVLEQEKTKPLQLGEGAIAPCLHSLHLWGPAICVVPRCSNKDEDSQRGDSGGPVFYEGRVVAVISAGVFTGQSINTPVSPYLNWMKYVMSKETT